MAGFILICLALAGTYIIAPWWWRDRQRRRARERIMRNDPAYTVLPVMLFRGVESNGDEGDVLAKAMSIRGIPEGEAPFAFVISAKGQDGVAPTIIETAYIQPKAYTGQIITAIRASLGDRAVIRSVIDSTDAEAETAEQFGLPVGG
jgi:hypothetical protein